MFVNLDPEVTTRRGEDHEKVINENGKVINYFWYSIRVSAVNASPRHGRLRLIFRRRGGGRGSAEGPDTGTTWS